MSATAAAIAGGIYLGVVGGLSALGAWARARGRRW